MLEASERKEGERQTEGWGEGRNGREEAHSSWAAGHGLTDGIPKPCQRLSSMVLVTVNSPCNKKSTKGPAVSCTYVTHSGGHLRKAITTHCMWWTPTCTQASWKTAL